MAVVDKAGRLVRFTIRPGNAAEAPELTTLLDGVPTRELIADKAYDSNPIRLALASQGIVATIPPRVNRRIQYWYDPIQYRTRHLVENFFCDLKQFRAVATRYNKLGGQLHCHDPPGLVDHRDQDHAKDGQDSGLQAKRQIPSVRYSVGLTAGADGLNVHRP